MTSVINVQDTFFQQRSVYFISKQTINKQKINKKIIRLICLQILGTIKTMEKQFGKNT